MVAAVRRRAAPVPAACRRILGGAPAPDGADGRVTGRRAARQRALFTHAAAIHSIRRGERGFVVTLRFKHKDESWPVGAIVNCTGPGGAATGTLGRALLDDGLARRDPTGTGLDVDGQGRLVDRDGVASDRILAIGPTRRGAWWETTAVPEIRAQAAALAVSIRAAAPARVPVAA